MNLMTKRRINLMTDSITVTVESEDEDVPESRFIKSIVDHALNSLGRDDAQVNVQIVDAKTIKSLNSQYRDKDAPTNVLSFGSDLPEWVGSNLIGDIVLCPAIIQKEATQFNKSLNSRWAHMLVHGTLHLLGMTHDEEQKQNEMETMEQKIMHELGYDDPYQVVVG